MCLFTSIKPCWSCCFMCWSCCFTCQSCWYTCFICVCPFARNGGFPGLFKVQENGAQSLLCGIVIMFISPGSSCDMCLCLLSITSPSVIERRHVSKSLLHGCRHVTDLVLQVLVWARFLDYVNWVLFSWCLLWPYIFVHFWFAFILDHCKRLLYQKIW
jgi:hypothetical protein